MDMGQPIGQCRGDASKRRCRSGLHC